MNFKDITDIENYVKGQIQMRFLVWNINLQNLMMKLKVKREFYSKTSNFNAVTDILVIKLC